MQDEGTVTCWLNTEHSDLATNDQEYNFHKEWGNGISITAKKRPDKTLTIVLDGLLRQVQLFDAPMPEIEKPDGLHVCNRWKDLEIQLLLNAKLAKVSILGSGKQ